jgi:hypothetical protein
MEKITPQRPPIENAADYIDALIRPNLKDQVVKKKTIEGRRMRDKYLDGVLIVEVAKKPG